MLRAIDLAGAVVTIALLAVVAFNVAGPPRVALAIAFVTFVPGWAALGHSHVAEGLSKVALAVALSLTVCTAGAVAMVWLGPWRPFALFYGVGAVSLLALFWGSTRAVRPVAPLAAPAPIDLTTPLAPVEHDHVPAAEPRRHTVWPESLRLTHVAVRVVFLPRPPFNARELTDFFAAIPDGNSFTDFHRDGDDGAVMETRGSRRLEVRRDSVEYSETSPRDFQEAKHHAVDLLCEIQRRFEVGALANPSCRLHATLGPDADGGFLSGLLSGAAAIDPQRTSLLGGSGPLGVGVRFTGQSDDPRHTWQAMLETNGRDGLVSLDVVADFRLSADNPFTVGGCLERAHQFLTTGVVPFVKPSPSGRSTSP